MGDLLSTQSQLNPSSSPTTQEPPTMSSSDSLNSVQKSSDPTTDTEILEKHSGESKIPIQESSDPTTDTEILKKDSGESKTPIQESSDTEILKNYSRESKTPTQESSDPPKSAEINENLGEESVNLSEEDLENSIIAVEEGEEEVAECGFCLFMKGGGCKDTFTEWENCVKESEENKEDIVEKCFQATSALKKCMEAHSDYYEPLLQAEKDAEQEAMRQLEEEKALEEEKSKSGDQERIIKEEKAKLDDQEGIMEESMNKEKLDALDGSEEHEKI